MIKNIIANGTWEYCWLMFFHKKFRFKKNKLKIIAKKFFYLNFVCIFAVNINTNTK